MIALLWGILGFVLGSLPFSVWVGRWAASADIRAVGDKNPGAANVLRLAGVRWFILAMLLDGFKGAIPVGLAWFSGAVSGWGMALVAISPVLGHMFSPWLGGRGGKAVAVSFGIWAGLTLGAGPTVLGLLLGLMVFLWRSSAWAVATTLGLFGVFVFTYYDDQLPLFGVIWAANAALLLWKHWPELDWPPQLRRHRWLGRDNA